MISGILAVVAAAVAIAPAAAAQDGGLAVDTLSEIARAAEERGDPRAARQAWAAVVEAAPSSRQAARARRRLEWLDARSEGDFAPLAEIMRFRATDPGARDAGAIAELERVIASMPEGRVRVEARQLVAGEWMRVGAVERAIASYRALIEDRAAGEGDRAVARQDLARALAAAGRRDEALETLGSGGGAVRSQIARERRRAIGVPVAISVIVAFAVLGTAIAASGVRRGARGVIRRGLAPARVISGAWVTVVPWAIARAYDEEASDTFALLAAGSAVVVALASVAGAASPPLHVRIALAIGAVLAALAVGYLVGDRDAALLGILR